MSTGMVTLHEIAVKHARKQKGMVDSLTEEAPILNHVKWKAASHGLWNVAERLTDIEGPAFVAPDAPLPQLSVSSDLVTTDLHVMGGTMEVPTQRARKFGGPLKYFAEKQNYLLKKAGMDTERQLVFQNWLKGALAVKNVHDAGGTSGGFFLLAVRFDELSNVGLFDPDQFDSGRLLTIEFPYGGDEHYLHSPGYEGVLGYSVTYRGNFGYQLLDAARTVAAIVNIDESHHPTPDMIDDMLAQVRSKPGTTFIFTSPRGKIHGINPFKAERVRLASGDTDAGALLESWAGISIVESHNIAEKQPHIKVK